MERARLSDCDYFLLYLCRPGVDLGLVGHSRWQNSCGITKRGQET